MFVSELLAYALQFFIGLARELFFAGAALANHFIDAGISGLIVCSMALKTLGFPATTWPVCR